MSSQPIMQQSPFATSNLGSGEKSSYHGLIITGVVFFLIAAAVVIILVIVLSDEKRTKQHGPHRRESRVKYIIENCTNDSSHNDDAHHHHSRHHDDEHGEHGDVDAHQHGTSAKRSVHVPPSDKPMEDKAVAARNLAKKIREQGKHPFETETDDGGGSGEHDKGPQAFNTMNRHTTYDDAAHEMKEDTKEGIAKFMPPQWQRQAGIKTQELNGEEKEKYHALDSVWEDANLGADEDEDAVDMCQFAPDASKCMTASLIGPIDLVERPTSVNPTGDRNCQQLDSLYRKLSGYAGCSTMLVHGLEQNNCSEAYMQAKANMHHVECDDGKNNIIEAGEWLA